MFKAAELEVRKHGECKEKKIILEDTSMVRDPPSIA